MQVQMSTELSRLTGIVAGVTELADKLGGTRLVHRVGNRWIQADREGLISLGRGTRAGRSISELKLNTALEEVRIAFEIETMEAAGLVGPLQSNGMREVLAPAPPEE